MTIHIENEWNGVFDFDVDRLVEKVVKASLKYLKCPYEVECDVLFTGNEGMQGMNKKFRQIDAPTDVLSFPMVDWDGPCEYEVMEKDKTYFSPENGELFIGDMVISCDKVFEQAKEYGHSIKREISFLVVHSVLHLFGYDHMEETEATRMEFIQEEILNQLGIGR